MSPTAIIVPHAGRTYAGPARAAAFEATDKQRIKTIVYLANVHGAPETSVVWRSQEQPARYKSEHSYAWVADELAEVFPRADVQVFYVPQGLSQDAAVRVAIEIPKADLIIAAVDFTHYGSEQSYGTPNSTLSWPWRLSKMSYEDKLIAGLLAADAAAVDQELQKKHYVTCSPGVLRLVVALVAARLPKTQGHVVEYYDSDACFVSQNCHTDALFEPYVIDPAVQQRPQFVSYCSIVYCPTKPRAAQAFDVRFAFGLMYSVLLKQLLSPSDYEIRMPSWSPWRHMTNGVFVGTQIPSSGGGGLKTTCSYGRYETENSSRQQSTGDMMLAAIGDCIRDSIDRWREPITMMTLPATIMKIEVLEDMQSWRSWSSIEDYMSKFKLDGRLGTYLTLANGSSATYLPVVAAEQAGQWTVRDYLENLAAKAGGRLTSGSSVKTYKHAAVFFSDNKSLSTLES